MKPDHDTVDLREIGSAIRHGGRWIVGGALVGLLLGGLLTLMVRPVYEGTATILLRSDVGGGAAALAGSSSGEDGVSLGGLADMLSMGSGFDTEMEILTSRSVVASVIDSLGLQARVAEPDSRSLRSVFASFEFPAEISERSYRFEREGERFRVRGPGVNTVVAPGEPVSLDAAHVVLRRSGLPDAFEVQLVGMDEAVERFRKQLSAEKAGGDVAELVFDAGDPRTAAAVPNAMIAQYLARRKTTDRGINQHRYEFLAQHTDSIESALAVAAGQLRRYQEGSGVLDPEAFGEQELLQAARLRAQLEDLTVESRGLSQVLGRGRVSARDVAAYPSLLRNGAINGILARLSAAEEQRTALLERRTERDPDVVALSTTIRQLEDELFTLSRSYLDGLARQEAQVREELGRYETTLDALPEQAEQTFRLQREVERLSETLVALRTQLVQTRLATIAEGGEVRPIDLASPPAEPEFPKPILNLAGGLLGGLFFGTAAAIGAATLRRRVREPWEAELVAGVPAAWLEPRAPLLLGIAGEPRVVCVLPVGRGARSGPVAERLAATATLQGKPAACVDLESSGSATASGHDAAGTGSALVRRDGGEGSHLLEPIAGSRPAGYPIYRANGSALAPFDGRGAVEDLARRAAPVIVALPPLEDPLVVALLALNPPVVLALRSAEVGRAELEESLRSVERAGGALAGVVIEDGRSGHAKRRSHSARRDRIATDHVG